MCKSRMIILAMAVVLALGILSALPSFAADTKSTFPVFASVDLQKITEGADRFKQMDDQFTAFGQSLQLKLQLRAANKMLNDDEFAQLVTLKMKSKPTTAEIAQLDDLLAKASSREKDFQSLQQKPNISDAERTRMADLQAQSDKGDSKLKDENAKYRQDLEKQRQDMLKQVQGEVDIAVASVAKDKGISVVFPKGSVYYCSNDITDDVVKKLNAK